jgi:hypothetical protein
VILHQFSYLVNYLCRVVINSPLFTHTTCAFVIQDMFGRCGTRLQITQAQTVLAENPSQIILSSVSERRELITTPHSCEFLISPLKEPKSKPVLRYPVRACLSVFCELRSTLNTGLR